MYRTNVATNLYPSKFFMKKNTFYNLIDCYLAKKNITLHLNNSKERDGLLIYHRGIVSSACRR